MGRTEQLKAEGKTWIVVVYSIETRTPHYHGPFPTEGDAKAYASVVPLVDENNRKIRTVGYCDLTVNIDWLIESHAQVT